MSIKQFIKSYIKQNFPDLYIKIRNKTNNDCQIDLRRLKELIDAIDSLIKVENIEYEDSAPIIILVTPWLGTAIPFQFILMAYIYRYQGVNVRILWNDNIKYMEGSCEYEQKVIRNFLFSIKSNIVPIDKYTSFSEYKGKKDIQWNNKFYKMACYMAIHHLRTSIFLNKNRNLINLYYNGLINDSFAIKNICEKYNKSTFIVPGGICGNTSLFYYFSHEYKGIRVASLDSYINGNTLPAVHKDSFNEFKKYINDISHEEKKKILLDAEKNFYKRMTGQELYIGINEKLQIGKINEKYFYDVIIVPNIEWDSAALVVDSIFKTMIEWIEETVAFLLKNTNYTIVIRQHPGERVIIKSFGYENFFKCWVMKKYKDEERVTFYDCDAKVNTYALIKNVKVVLPWTSDVAVDAALMGKMSVVNTNVYYKDELFAINCENKNEYFRAIIDVVEKKINNNCIDEAKCVYFFHDHFFVKGNSIDSTPQIFNKFISNKLKDIFQDEILLELLKSWRENKSFMLLDYLRTKSISHNIIEDNIY